MTGIDAQLQKRLPATRETEAFDLDVHFQADNGVTVLFGASGSGKTLTLNCLAGFVRPDEGRVQVNGQVYFDSLTGVHLPPHHRQCGYLFQDHALFPHMTVRDNLLFPAKHRKSRVQELLEIFELAHLADRKPAQLSGGQKQRAALARIMVSEPHLLLLDEPARGLDARLRESFYHLLRKTQEQRQIPVVLVTHQVEECLRLGDSICVMQEGQILQTGARDTVLARPASVEVVRNLGLHNLLPAEITSLRPSRMRVKGQEVIGPPDLSPHHHAGQSGFLCLRESDVALATETITADHGFALYLAVVASNPAPGGIRVQCENDFYITVTETQWAQQRHGTHLQVTWPPAAVHFIP